MALTPSQPKHHGKEMPLQFRLLASTLAKIQTTPSSLAKQHILSDLFLNAYKVDRPCLPALLKTVIGHGAIKSPQEPMISVGSVTLTKAIANATNSSAEVVNDHVRLSGDIGISAAELWCRNRKEERDGGITRYNCSETTSSSSPPKPLVPPLTVSSFYESLMVIATFTGPDSTQRTVDSISKLIANCTSKEEVIYTVRSVLSSGLRTGMATKSVLSALANAIVSLETEGGTAGTKALSPSNAAKMVNMAYARRPDIDALVNVISTSGIGSLDSKYPIHPCTPFQTMQASAAFSVDEVLKRMIPLGPFVCEVKYDGARVQIHGKEGAVRVYSRSAEEYPTPISNAVAKIVSSAVHDDVKSFILDGEIVAVNDSISTSSNLKEILPFQVLSHHLRRKETERVGVEEEQGHAKVKGKTKAAEYSSIEYGLYCFDLLSINDKALTNEKLDVRQRVLRSSFTSNGQFNFVHSLVCDGNPNNEESHRGVINNFLREAISIGSEGAVIKSSASTYTAGERSFHWLKLKKDHVNQSSVGGDTIDLVPIGAFWGKGKRKGLFGSYLMACYYDTAGTFHPICKVGTGFSDEQLRSNTAELSPYIIASSPGGGKAMQPAGADLNLDLPPTFSTYPDVWFKPSQVWEIAYSDLTVSSSYRILTDDGSFGVGVRFPRFYRHRGDKSVDSTTTTSQILQLYRGQNIKLKS
jgi:DNA ligase-1